MEANSPSQPDATLFSARELVSALFVKAGRRLQRVVSPPSRLTWTTRGVSDTDGPAANVRNYLERRTLRDILTKAADGKKMKRACEVGCGYGRLVMVLKEFADEAVGFEREPHLGDIARFLLPDVSIVRVESLDALPDPGPMDFAMTVSVLQHLTDERATKVCAEMRRLVPRGHVLIVEKTEAHSVTENTTNEAEFISRARPVELYEKMMAPYKLVHTQPRRLEPGYRQPNPGVCMLFKAP